VVGGTNQGHGDFAHDKGAKLHIDGARLFDAAIARKTTAAKLAAGPTP